MPFAEPEKRNRYMRGYLRRRRAGVRTVKPLPVNVEALKMYATDWAERLRILRYGRPAELYMVKKSERVQDGARITSTRHIFIAPFQPESDEARRLLSEMPRKSGDGEWEVRHSALAKPEIWKRLCTRSTKDTREALTQIEAFIPESARAPDSEWHLLLHAGREHADELRRAKNLPQYPHSERQSSDRKRIEFFAKVLSGLALGCTPLYTLKILAGWHPPTLYLAEKEQPAKPHGRTTHTARRL